MHDRVSHRARAAAVAGVLAFALALPVVAESATAPATDATVAGSAKPTPGTAHKSDKTKPVAKKATKTHKQTAQKPAALKKVEPVSPAVNGATGK